MQLGELTWALEVQLLADHNPSKCGSILLLGYSVHKVLVHILEVVELQ
jgi:hypothetical protein